ncbi:hypothetical protein [Streptomyces sp. NPDC051218]|uniref:hypothetical protein n=1 Tax=Streptomyces sp. NPDC051218 TaxID=3365645 RepID=UPI0037A5AFC6
MSGVIAAVTAEQLAGVDLRERNLRAELAGGCLQLLEEAATAIESGAPERVVTALLDALIELTDQLRDRLLDGVVASSLVPDRWRL